MEFSVVNKSEMKAMAGRVADIVGPVIGGMGYELLGVELGNRGRGLLVRIYIDNENGVKLDDCAAVSRRVSALLDVEDLIAGYYDLEVSSPGLERPLFNEAQYKRYLSHKVKIVMAAPQMGRKRFTGILKDVSDGRVAVEIADEIYDLPLAEIASGRLAPDISLSGIKN